MRILSLCPLSLLISTSAFAAPAVDTITFGNDASEQAHHLSMSASDVISGGLGEKARRLNPLQPTSHNGGWVTFRLKVDPEKQNYFTIKLWGSDKGEGAGRLILYLDGKQVGYRHEGEYDVLNQSDAEAIMPGRFLYQTIALPPAMTKGRGEVELRIAGLGRMWPYGSTFALKQRQLTEPTRGLYRAYTHVEPRFEADPAEKQGAAPAIATRPALHGDAMLQQMRDTVVARIGQLMTADPATQGDPQVAMLTLAEAYHTPWTPAYHNPRAVMAMIDLGDAYLRKANLDPANWQGAGPFGEAIARLGRHELLDRALDKDIEAKLPADLAAVVAHAPGVTEKMTRRAAWAKLLRLSIDGHRLYGRRAYTNQSMIVDYALYGANRGLQIVDPAQALPEKAAMRYLYEAAGLAPWLGNDLADGGHDAPYGRNYFLFTPKGLSRELGWVATYGETILLVLRNMAELSGDAALRQQLMKVQQARMPFRYPAQDADGYRQMKLVSEMDNRTAHFPLDHGAYSGANVSELWWMEIAAFLRDPVSVGAAQQSLEEEQYFYRLGTRVNHRDTIGMMRNIDEYAIVSRLPKSPYRLPMGDNQPDFAFADEDDGVLTVKHGRDRLFVNFYYRQEFAPSGSTRVVEIQPDRMRIATVKAKIEVDNPAGTWVRPDVIDMERNGGLPPPGEKITQAWAGEKLTIASRPADAREPAYGQWGPFVGKASFYSLRYGPYLIGLNTSDTRSHVLETPKGGKAKDLITGQWQALVGKITVAPHQTVVLDLSDNSSARP